MENAKSIAGSASDAQPEHARDILTRACLRAADLLSVPQQQLAKLLGVSAATVTRMRQGAYALEPNRKEWDLALLFLRLFRSLDSIVAGRETDARAWLHSDNQELRGKPAELILQVSGLVHVADYLDAVRARV